jgi:hypothetical protein
MANDGKSRQNETREEQCSFPSSEVHSGTSNFTTHRPIAVHPDLGEIEDGGVATGVALRELSRTTKAWRGGDHLGDVDELTLVGRPGAARAFLGSDCLPLLPGERRRPHAA